eukprot:TRINITY_DN36212_c0_g1_i1.p1 TRINITY_DN36212_c0_g1~~TRINITY_DN36212_c0_g1_i1.p1  ORF type:complete len:159 (+),score=12.24 TRINITY_DN36212_c0_g1_i1:472-948(+)
MWGSTMATKLFPCILLRTSLGLGSIPPLPAPSGAECPRAPEPLTPSSLLCTAACPGVAVLLSFAHAAMVNCRPPPLPVIAAATPGMATATECKPLGGGAEPKRHGLREKKHARFGKALTELGCTALPTQGGTTTGDKPLEKLWPLSLPPLPQLARQLA